MTSRASKGVHFGRAPYGYRRMKVDDVVTWEQEPEEARAVREMRRLAVQENFGHKRIADRLSEQGYPTRNGRPWAAYTVQHILTNEALAGTLVYGKRPKPGNPAVRLVRVEGFFPAILNAEEWSALEQRLLIRRGSPRGSTHTSDYLLSGIVRCGHCGGPMVGKKGYARKGRQYRSYYCTTAMTSRARCAYYNGHATAKRCPLGPCCTAHPMSDLPPCTLFFTSTKMPG